MEARASGPLPPGAAARAAAAAEVTAATAASASSLRSPAIAPAFGSGTSRQGLTLVHFSAHLKQFPWNTLGGCRAPRDKKAQVELRSGLVTRGLHSITFGLK